MFLDVTYPSGLGRMTLSMSGWSTGIFDLNNDGWKDLFAACGDVQDNSEQLTSIRTRQRNLVLANLGGMRFADASAGAGPDFQQLGMHRGAAFGDLDGDGRVDVVVTRIGQPAEVFRNTSRATNHWLALRLIGHKSNRDAIGARVHLVGASGLEQWNHVTTSVGYGCSSDRTVYVGLGKDAFARQIEIIWPSGVKQKLANVPADRRLTIDEPPQP